jgi:hypothetical protein
MARPLRIEFPGAVYHVTSRGDRREAIFDDDQDRHAFLNVVAQEARGQALPLALFSSIAAVQSMCNDYIEIWKTHGYTD